MHCSERRSKMYGLSAWAALLWGTTEPLHESRSVAIPPAIYERMVALVRSQLSEAAFTSAWAQGRSMTPEQALAAQETAEMLMSAPTESPSIPPGKTSSAYPAGLTAREVEVLRMVAQGLSDDEVVSHLVISP